MEIARRNDEISSESIESCDLIKLFANFQTMNYCNSGAQAKIELLIKGFWHGSVFDQRIEIVSISFK